MSVTRKTWKLCALLLVVSAQVFGANESDSATIGVNVEELEARIRILEREIEDAKLITSDQPQNTAEIGSERNAESPSDDALGVKMGGALRFNLIYREGVDASVGKRGEGGLDVFRLNVDGKKDNLIISAEYRFYAYMNVIHHGWVGYEFDDDSQLQLGITQVPIGLLPYASHNSWYGIPYYIGLADDYDMGLKYQRRDGPWSVHLAFYKNEELNDATNLDRYAFDLVRVNEQQNEETNQLNGRLAYTFGLHSECETEVGGSFEVGQLYNAVSDRTGDRWLAAAHLDNRCGRWNFQLQGMQYKFDAKNPPGVRSSVVHVGAFAGSYDIDSDASVVVANIAYNFASPWHAIQSLTCYNDYSRLNKSISGAVDSQINTVGCAIGSGALFTYVDYIYAKNMPYFGSGSLADDGESDWQGRLNINIGYYW